MSYELERAQLEAARITAEDAYFTARPPLDSADRRKVFDAGFDRGWEARRNSADDELLAALEGVLPFLTGDYWPGVEADSAVDFAIAIARKVGSGGTAPLND